MWMTRFGWNINNFSVDMITNIGSILTMLPRSGNAYAFRRLPYWSQLAAGATGGQVDLGWVDLQCLQQRWADIDFLPPDSYPKNFLHIHIQSLSKNFWNLVSDIHPYPTATLAKYATNRQWLFVQQWTFFYEILFIPHL